MPSEQPAGGRSLSTWISTLGSVIAPTTLVGALLLYFGFAFTDAFYEYFGLDPATMGLSTQDYLLRSAGALYLPAGVALLLALLGLVAYYRASALAGGSTAGRQYVRRGGRTVMACGMLLFLGGLLGGFAAVKVPPLVVPLLLGSGLVLTAYGRVLEVKGSGERYPVAREAGAIGILAALVALSLFWAVNVWAQEHGTSEGRYLADHLWLRPEVVLDTTERLYFQYPGVQETTLPEARAPQRFRYRYRGLRLLAQAGNRMFVIPDDWTIDYGSVLIVPIGPDVRVAFHPG